MTRQKFLKWAILMFVMGLVYTNIELLTRAVGMELVGWHDIKSYSLVGWTSLWMIPIGGFAVFLLGLLNAISLTRSWKMWQISLAGMILIFSIELLSGIICNTLLHMAIWNYTTLDICGQISLLYAVPWFLLVPFSLWLDDLLRHYMFAEPRPEKISRYYRFDKPVPRYLEIE